MLIATFLLQIANADLRFATIRTVSPGQGMARTWDRQWFRPSGPVDAPRTAAADEVGPPSRQIVEVMRAAQQQGVAERPFEMAVGALDRAVLMRYAGMVAGRRHAVDVWRRPPAAL